MNYPTRIAKLSCYLSIAAVLVTGCQTASEPPASPVTAAVTEQPASPEQKRVSEQTSNQPLETSQETAAITDVWERLRQGFQLQQHYDHPAVVAYIERYSANQRLFDLVTERASPFLFHIVEETEARGLPLELALLPIVESTFNPSAYSAEHAVGLWQFLGPTARSFGVQLDWWYDGRRDPLVSTTAALDYLSALHQQFSENWLVAIGAYNTGGGNVRRAIRRGQQDMDELDFWDLPLHPETRSHVPKLLALAAIVSAPDKAGVELMTIANTPALERVEISGQIDLSQAAALAGLSSETLKLLNPGYLRWATHPDHPQSVLVPVAKAQQLRSALVQANPEEFMTWDRYEIQPGDTLGQIARALGTQVDILQTVNGIRGSNIIAGDSLLIPRNVDSITQLKGGQYTNPIAGTSNLRQSTPPPAVYVVRRGDNLWSIARRYNLKSSDISRRNTIAMDSILRPGQKLHLDGLGTDTLDNHENQGFSDNSLYSVKRGDSIALIAKRSGQRIRDILSWNSLTRGELIYPGQQLRLTPPSAVENN